MSLLGALFGGSSIGGIIGAIGTVIDKVFTSEEERENARYLLKRLEQEPYLLQAEINKVQARHKSLFVAGARPALMWVCVLGLFFGFIIAPVLTMFGLPTPNIPLELMYNLVIAMLGLGAFRTYEKVRGVQSDDFRMPQPRVEFRPRSLDDGRETKATESE